MNRHYTLLIYVFSFLFIFARTSYGNEVCTFTDNGQTITIPIPANYKAINGSDSTPFIKFNSNTDILHLSSMDEKDSLIIFITPNNMNKTEFAHFKSWVINKNIPKSGKEKCLSLINSTHNIIPSTVDDYQYFIVDTPFEMSIVYYETFTVMAKTLPDRFQFFIGTCELVLDNHKLLISYIPNNGTHSIAEFLKDFTGSIFRANASTSNDIIDTFFGTEDMKTKESVSKTSGILNETKRIVSSPNRITKTIPSSDRTKGISFSFDYPEGLIISDNPYALFDLQYPDEITRLLSGNTSNIIIDVFEIPDERLKDIAPEQIVETLYNNGLFRSFMKKESKEKAKELSKEINTFAGNPAVSFSYELTSDSTWGEMYTLYYTTYVFIDNRAIRISQLTSCPINPETISALKVFHEHSLPVINLIINSINNIRY